MGALRSALHLAAALLVAAAAGGAEAQPPGGDVAQPAPQGRSTAAAEARRHIDRGQQRYTELDFIGAIDALRRALSVSGIPEALRLEAYEYLGSSYVALNRPDAAREAFEAMLELDPYHVVREPSGSPKIRQFVERVRSERVADAAFDPDLELEPQLPRAGYTGRETTIDVRVRGPTESVSTLRLHYRGSQHRTWQHVAAGGSGGAYSARLPAMPQSDELELYVQARDGQGRVVARAGEPLMPLTLTIRPRKSEPTPVWQRWWFWTAVGAALAGGAITLGLTLPSDSQPPAGSLPPGRVKLP